MAFTVWVSTTNMNLGQGWKPLQYVGLRNFVNLVTTEKFWKSVQVTLHFTLVALALEFGLGILLAHLFNREMKGIKIFRTILVIPVLMPPLTIGYTFRYIFQPSFGLINLIPFLRGVNMLSAELAIYSAIIVDVWQWTPFMFLVFLSGLRSLPREPFEAARVDGASTLRTVWSVELPMLKNLIRILLLLRGLEALQTFTQIWCLTRGGPGLATTNIPIQIYKVGFYTFEMGPAASLSWLFVVMANIMVLSLTLGLREK